MEYGRFCIDVISQNNNFNEKSYNKSLAESNRASLLLCATALAFHTIGSKFKLGLRQIRATYTGDTEKVTRNIHNRWQQHNEYPIICKSLIANSQWVSNQCLTKTLSLGVECVMTSSLTKITSTNNYIIFHWHNQSSWPFSSV